MLVVATDSAPMQSNCNSPQKVEGIWYSFEPLTMNHLNMLSIRNLLYLTNYVSSEAIN